MGKIIIAGGSGFLGSFLTDSLVEKGFRIIILSRKNKSSSHPYIKYVQWDGKTQGEWVKELEQATAVINLSGKSINTRFTKENKKQLLKSRIDSTTAIAQAISNCNTPPKTWINASGAGIYGDKGDQQQTESSQPGEDFVAHLSKKWEEALFSAQTPNTRKVALRTAVVLSKEGGALKPLINLSKFYLGGKAGNGKQYMAWIHYKDWVGLIEWILDNESIHGPVNLAAPQEVTNEEFMAEFRKALEVPFGLPQPAIFVKIGAFAMGTDPSLILNSQRVVPKVAKDTGYPFKFPTLKAALSEEFGVK